MQSTKIGADFCRAQNYHRNNISFKAKFSNETIAKMGQSFSNDYLNLYKDIANASEKVSVMGSKDTVIKIENPKDTSFDDGKLISLGSAYNEDYYEEDWRYQYAASLKFTNPLIKDSKGKELESIVNFEKKLSHSEYKKLKDTDVKYSKAKDIKLLDVAKDIDSETLEQGEEGLAIAYVKDLIEKHGNNGSLVEASKEFISKLEQSDFSKKAITTIKNAVKSIDLKNKLDSRITKLLKI